MTKKLLIFTLPFGWNVLLAQHTEHQEPAMNKMSMDFIPMMSHSFSRNLPMNRNGSGTSWQPDSTSVYAYMAHAGKWNFMFHGSFYLRYTYQDVNSAGKRGDKKLDAPNWFMIMGQRNIGNNPGMMKKMSLMKM